MADTNTDTKSEIKVTYSKMKTQLAELSQYYDAKVPNEILRFGNVFAEYANDVLLSAFTSPGYRKQIRDVGRDVKDYIKSDSEIREVIRDEYSDNKIFLDIFAPVLDAADNNDIDVAKNKFSEIYGDITHRVIEYEITNRMGNSMKNAAKVFSKCLGNIEFTNDGVSLEYNPEASVTDEEFKKATEELSPENHQKEFMVQYMNKLTNEITSEFKKINPNLSVEEVAGVYVSLIQGIDHENFVHSYKVIADARKNVEKSVNDIDPSGKTLKDMNHYIEMGIPEWFGECATVLSDEYMKRSKSTEDYVPDRNIKRSKRQIKKAKIESLIALDNVENLVTRIEDKSLRQYSGPIGADDLYHKRLDDAVGYFTDKFEIAKSRDTFVEFLDNEDLKGLQECVDDSIELWGNLRIDNPEDEYLESSLNDLVQFKGEYLGGPESLHQLRRQRLPISDIQDFITLQYSLQNVNKEDIHQFGEVMKNTAENGSSVTLSFTPGIDIEGSKVSDVEVQVEDGVSFNIPNLLNGAVGFYKLCKDFYDVPSLNPHMQ